MKEQESNRYLTLLSSLASPSLRAVAHCDVQFDAVTLGIPAARLLIEEDRLVYSYLVEGFYEISKLGGQDAPMVADSYG